VTYGGDSGNMIFVLYWRCPLIRVSVVRGSTIFPTGATVISSPVHQDRFRSQISLDSLHFPVCVVHNIIYIKVYPSRTL
jgi:hypothetical protein